MILRLCFPTYMILWFYDFLHSWGQSLSGSRSPSSLYQSKQQVFLLLPPGDDNNKDSSSLRVQQRYVKGSVPLLLLGNALEALCSALASWRRCNTRWVSPHCSSTLQSLWSAAGRSGTCSQGAWTPLHCTAMIPCSNHWQPSPHSTNKPFITSPEVMNYSLVILKKTQVKNLAFIHRQFAGHKKAKSTHYFTCFEENLS